MAKDERLEEIDGFKLRNNIICVYGRKNKTRYQITLWEEDGTIIQENRFEEDYLNLDSENYRKTEIYDMIINRIGKENLIKII
jgi:hypothetical protein